MDITERQRRHDERWQKAVVDGMARTLDVLHDISDAIRELTGKLEMLRQPIDQAPSEGSLLLSVEALAALLGTSSSVIRGLRSSGKGPRATRLGSRLYLHRSDVDEWLEQNRELQEVGSRPWRQSYLPGRIGTTIPSSSEKRKLPWCEGSNTEPMSASRYSGRAVCRICRDDVLVNQDGRIRKHHSRTW